MLLGCSYLPTEKSHHWLGFNPSFLPDVTQRATIHCQAFLQDTWIFHPQGTHTENTQPIPESQACFMSQECRKINNWCLSHSPGYKIRILCVSWLHAQGSDRMCSATSWDQTEQNPHLCVWLGFLKVAVRTGWWHRTQCTDSRTSSNPSATREVRRHLTQWHPGFLSSKQQSCGHVLNTRVQFWAKTKQNPLSITNSPQLRKADIAKLNRSTFSTDLLPQRK